MQLVLLKAVALDDVRSQAALAERLLMDAPAVSRMVDRLEEEGWVRRGPGADRHSVRLEVTPEGMAQVEVYLAGLQWMQEEVSKHLPPHELSELMRLMQKVQTSLSQGHEAAPREGTGEE